VTRPKLGRPLPGEPVIKRRCQARTKDGRPCGATPMVHKRKVNGKNIWVCLFHYGNFAQTLGAKGGRHGAQRDPKEIVQYEPPQSADELVPILSSTISEIRAGKIDQKTVQALVSTSGAFLESLKIADLDKRLKVLEKKQIELLGSKD
jgi:hypothetical protein